MLLRRKTWLILEIQVSFKVGFPTRFPRQSALVRRTVFALSVCSDPYLRWRERFGRKGEFVAIRDLIFFLDYVAVVARVVPIVIEVVCPQVRLWKRDRAAIATFSYTASPRQKLLAVAVFAW